MGIRYICNAKPEYLILAASDVSFAGDSNQKSTQSFLIKLFGGPIVSDLGHTLEYVTTCGPHICIHIELSVGDAEAGTILCSHRTIRSGF